MLFVKENTGKSAVSIARFMDGEDCYCAGGVLLNLINPKLWRDIGDGRYVHGTKNNVLTYDTLEKVESTFDVHWNGIREIETPGDGAHSILGQIAYMNDDLKMSFKDIANVLDPNIETVPLYERTDLP